MTPTVTISIEDWERIFANMRTAKKAFSTLAGKLQRAGDFSSMMDADHNASWIDSDGHKWVGMPLWYLLGRVDDSLSHGTNAFNRTLADKGYTVRVKASDGFSKDFDVAAVKLSSDFIVAYKMDGKALADADAPLKLVGPNLTKGQMVKKIAEIDIIFPS